MPFQNEAGMEMRFCAAHQTQNLGGAFSKSTFCLVNVIPNGQCAEVPNLDYDY